MVIYICDY